MPGVCGETGNWYNPGRAFSLGLSRHRCPAIVYNCQTFDTNTALASMISTTSWQQRWTASGLRASALATDPRGLIPANILVDAATRPVATLDFGFLTTVGDSALDAAIAASIYDMYGRLAAENEVTLDAAIID